MVDAKANFNVLIQLRDAEIHFQKFDLLQCCESNSDVRELAIVPAYF